MKIGVIIPDRSDRPKLLANCLRMLNNQTVQSSEVYVVNEAPSSPLCDITKRYRIGYDHFRNKGFDILFFIENDDWYSPTYIETMITEWKAQGKPDIFGTDYTIYYHIKLFAQFTMHHNTRSSAMSTIIKPDLNFNWCVDHEPYTDMHLWTILKGKVFKPQKHICLGIKHGTGLCGGRSHVDRLHRYKITDPDKSFLKSVMDADSYNFYTNYFNQ